MFAIPVLRMGMKAFKKSRAAKAEKTQQQPYQAQQPYPGQQNVTSVQSRKRSWPILLLAITPVLVTGISLILSILCVFAGHTTSMMQDYSVFTLNTSRIGQNVVQKLENKVRSFQLDDIGLSKRADLIILPATPTMAPTTLITMAPMVERDIFSGIESLGSKATHHIASDVHSLKSKGKGEISEATSYLHSKANSVESAVASEATSIVNKIENEIIKLINEAYTGLIDEMHIHDFYNVHVMASCRGTYVFQNGTNMTMGDFGPPTPTGPDSVHSHVDACEEHSAVDPLSLIRIVYWIGIVHVIAALVLAIWAAISPSRKVAFANAVLILFAFIALGLASIVAHGLALAATKVVNFLGNDLGLAAYLGHNFLALTWTATALMALNLLLLAFMYFVDKRHQPRCTCGAGQPVRPTEEGFEFMVWRAMQFFSDTDLESFPATEPKTRISSLSSVAVLCFITVEVKHSITVPSTVCTSSFKPLFLQLLFVL
ncbi:uncharacterized protein LTR77_009882 [Saxophila tyrrhenica]|uniref:Uncharacterized protein n=1 Tax=Saxophila tyrrhenica TaxID=1690608 RepID=A0AAV9NXJ2_9PEZI|nr:hypothetical protein LTR77_009882 [Saxophila tyrrhenica]